MKPILSSLADFILAGLRPRTPLARAIVLVLAVKLVIIVSMKVLLFSGDAQPAVDDAAMRRLIGPAPSVRAPGERAAIPSADASRTLLQ
jgi:hypothetical protein